MGRRVSFSLCPEPQRMSLLQESRLTMRLAMPLVIGQLSQMLLGVADTVMIGRLGVTDLAALTFCSALFHVPFVFGMGLLTGVSVLTSNARGADEPAAARASCRGGLHLALLLGAVLFGAGWLVSMRLDVFGQPPEVAARGTVYFQLIMASLVPGLASIALKNHADALNRPWPPFWIFLGGVLLNIVLNQALIFGSWGFPALGIDGAGWATLIARVAILAAVCVWLVRAGGLREWVPYRWWRLTARADLMRFLSIGVPASLQMLCEVAAFSAAGLIMGRFGPVAMAAHQIALTCAATAFMIPLGLSMALSVRIGEAHGAGERERLRVITLSGWALALAYALAGGAVFLAGGRWLSEWFIGDPEVIALSASLLVIVGIFQCFDSLQVCSSAMLRGLHDARMPALMGFVAYWLVGLPVAWGFAFWLGWEAAGVWCGLAAGLFVACLTLGRRLWKRSGCGKFRA